MSSDMPVSRRTLLAAAAALITAGCAGATGRGSRSELVWATGGIAAADQSPALDVAEQWNQRHPDGPAVRVQPLPSRTADDSYQAGDYAPGFNTMKLEDARKIFQSGGAVFMRSWPYAYRQMNGGDPDSQVAGKVGIAPLPFVAALGGHNLAVSAFSANTAAAIEFVRFASTSREVQLGLAQRHSLAPTLKAAYPDPAGDLMLSLLDRVLPMAKPRSATPEWFTISTEMQQQIFGAYTGSREPKAAVEALRKFLVATVEGS
jgi:ABC-type glycerol-3-phosphate transport system substrate-binding protein